MKLYKHLALALLLALCWCGTVAAATAKEQLLEMATKLATAGGYAVTIDITYDAVQQDGQKIEFGERRQVTLLRPDKLRVDTLQSDGDSTSLIFDGKTIYLYSEKEKVYAAIPFSGNVDDAVLFAGGKRGIRIPLARMLVTTFAQQLDAIIETSEFVEDDALRGGAAHLAATSANVDVQVWLDSDKLPQRMILTYKNEPGQPQFRANFSAWKLPVKADTALFTFTPPPGTEKIPSLVPVEADADAAAAAKKGATQ